MLFKLLVLYRLVPVPKPMFRILLCKPLWYQGLCELAVQKGITAENSAAILHTSDDLRASRLRDICMRFVVRHFDTVSKSEVRHESPIGTKRPPVS